MPSVILVTEVVDRCVHHPVNCDQSQLVKPQGIDFALEKHLSKYLDVLVEGAVHEEALTVLDIAEVLKECLHLGDQYLIELFLLGRIRRFGDLFYTFNVELKFGDEVHHGLDVGVVLRLREQVGQAKPTMHQQHKQLVELRRNREQDVVEIAERH